MIAVEAQTMRQFIHQIINIFRHEVSPIDYVPVMAHCL